VSGLTGFSVVTRRLVKERAGLEANGWVRCERCGVWNEYVEIHHRRARQRSRNKRWDTNLPSNGVALCAGFGNDCHGWVESNREQARESGLLLKQFQTPSAVSVQLWNGTWFLCDDGSVVPAPETKEAS
jgi:hypothetical protein